MVALPPGTLLQLMYLDERLKNYPSGQFIEIGPGSGEITHRLLQAGWSGTVYDLSEETIQRLKLRFASQIADKRLNIVSGDFLASPLPDNSIDLIISCMVMEHLDNDNEQKFMFLSACCLKANGLMIGLVPASLDYWGIEDEIAGHFRRYNTDYLLSLFQSTGWQIEHIAGLTYPISNILLPLSNYLVRRNEANKLLLSTLERTKHSGHRHVRFKTHFPAVIKYLLNEYTLLPFYWLQKYFIHSNKALVLYFEASHLHQEDPND